MCAKNKKQTASPVPAFDFSSGMQKTKRTQAEACATGLQKYFLLFAQLRKQSSKSWKEFLVSRGGEVWKLI